MTSLTKVWLRDVNSEYYKSIFIRLKDECERVYNIPEETSPDGLKESFATYRVNDYEVGEYMFAVGTNLPGTKTISIEPVETLGKYNIAVIVLPSGDQQSQTTTSDQDALLRSFRELMETRHNP